MSHPENLLPPEGAVPVDDVGPASGLDRKLLLATLAVLLIAGALIASVWIIETGMRQLRREAAPIPASRPEPAGPRATRPPARRSGGEPSLAWVGVDIEHRLASGILTVHVNGQLAHEASLAVRSRRFLFFRNTPDGHERFSLPVPPGATEIELLVRDRILGLELGARTDLRLAPGEWRLLIARVVPESRLLELRTVR